MDAFTVYVTTKDEQEARRLARLAVERRLAACANILPTMHSVYRWEGQVVEHPESVVLFKTNGGNLDELIGLLKEHHTYSVPCIVAWPIVGGDAAYIDWISEEVGQPAADEKDPEKDD